MNFVLPSAPEIKIIIVHTKNMAAVSKKFKPPFPTYMSERHGLKEKALIYLIVSCVVAAHVPSNKHTV